MRKRPSLARSSCSACLSSVMSCRTPNWRKGRPDSSHDDVALAVDYSHSAVGTEHSVFDIIAWTPGQQGRRRLGHSRLVLGVNSGLASAHANRQVDGLHPEDWRNLVRKKQATCDEVPLPPAKVRDVLRLLQPGFTLA